MLDIEGHILDVNESYCNMIGYSKQELLAMSISDISAGNSKEEVRDIINTVVSTGALRFEDRHRRKDGRLVEVDVSIQYKSPDGGRLVSFVRDNSIRKGIEEALKASEEKYRLLVDNNHDIIYTMSPEGIFLYVSPAWTNILGHPIEEVVGEPFQRFVHPDDVPKCREWLRNVMETGLHQEGIAYRVKHKDGSWRWHTSSAVPLHGLDGRITGFEGTARDITDRKNAEDKIKTLLAEKELLLKEVHHRIKNNMSTISSLLSLQAQTLTEPSAVNALEEAGQRVRSIGILYETLYRTENFNDLSAKDYLQSLFDEFNRKLPQKQIGEDGNIYPGFYIEFEAPSAARYHHQRASDQYNEACFRR